MAQHEISVQVRETFWLSGKNLRIGVESDGEVLGEIRISKSSLDWIPKGSKTAQGHASWEDFVKLMEKRMRRPPASSGRRRRARQPRSSGT